MIAKCEWCEKDAYRAFMDDDYVRYSCETHHDKTLHATVLDGRVCALKVSYQPIHYFLTSKYPQNPRKA